MDSDSEMEDATGRVPEPGSWAALNDDEDWTKFSKMVETTEKSWENFASFLHKKGDAKHDTLGIFAKLITRSVTVKQDNSELGDKCGFTILVGCFRLCTHTHSLPSETTNDMLSMIMTEIRHFSTKVLARSIEFCMDYMEKQGGDLPNRWMELFGKIIAELFQHHNIDFQGDCLSGCEYKTYVINALIRLEWGNKNAPTMIAIIRELPAISDSELESVLRKVQSSMESIDPPVLPPLTHQLLYLAGNSRPKIVLNILTEYFSTMDSYSIHHERHNVRVKALGTVLYHFIEGAKQYDIVIREVVKLLKASLHDRELIKSPFILALTLSLCTQLHLQAPIVEAFRNVVLRYYHEHDWNFMSAWCMQTRGSLKNDVRKMFDSVVKSKLFSLECVVEGVMHVGIGLLNGKLSRENPFCVSKCRELGSYLVATVVTGDKKYLPLAMKELLNHSDPFSVECVSKCFEASTRQLSSSPLSAKVHELITQFPSMPVQTASPIIKSLLPVFHLSSSLLDSLLIMTRKGVWKSIQSRMVSVQALILMLSYSPIIKDIAQDRFSQTQSIFGCSQTEEKIKRYTGIFDNDSLCFEVMTILRRFFTLQVEVRQQLYYGLHSTIRLNPELTNLICSNVQNHVKLYMTDDEKAIEFSKILIPAKSSSSDPVSIEEDLGLLIQCLCSVTSRGLYVFEDNHDVIPESVTHCEELIATWISIANELKLEDIYDISSMLLEKVEGVRPVDVSIVFIRNILIVQFLQVMEALLEHILLSKGTDPDQSQLLFKKINEFKIPIDALINPKGKQKSTAIKGKGAAKNKNKPKNNLSIDKDLDTSTKSVDEAKTKEKAKPHSKILYTHIMALSSVADILEQIYRIGKSSSENRALSSLKRNETFEKFLLQIVKEKVDLLKQKKPIKERINKMDEVFGDICRIFMILWKRCLSKTDKFNDRKDETDFEDKENFIITEMQFEIMFIILEVIWNQKPSLMKSLLRPLGDDNAEEYSNLLERFNNQWQMISVRYGSHPKCKPTMAYLFKILNIVLLSVPASYNSPGCSARKAFNWCLKFYGMKNKRIDGHDCHLLECLLTTLCTASNKSELMSEEFILIAKQAHFKLGDSVLDSPEDEGKPSWLVHEDTAESIICVLADYIEHQLHYVNSIIVRMKANCLTQFDRVDLDRKSRECCKRLLNLTRIACEIVPCAFPVGSSSVAVTKLIPKIYISLAGIAEYYCTDFKKNKVAFDSKAFKDLANFVGSDFKVNVEGFIVYIEQINREKADEIFKNLKTKKKGVYPAALKRQFANDTRNIPTIVYQLEKYEQHLFTLASKTKVNILAGTKLSTARDFRIKNIKEAFAGLNQSTTTQESDVETSDVELLEEGSPSDSDSRHLSRPNATNVLNSRSMNNISVRSTSNKRNNDTRTSSTDKQGKSKGTKADKSRTSANTSAIQNKSHSKSNSAHQPSSSKGLKRKLND